VHGPAAACSCLVTSAAAPRGSHTHTAVASSSGASRILPGSKRALPARRTVLRSVDSPPPDKNGERASHLVLAFVLSQDIGEIHASSPPILSVLNAISGSLGDPGCSPQEFPAWVGPSDRYNELLGREPADDPPTPGERAADVLLDMLIDRSRENAR
jgi:hypothetical protein